MTACTTMAGHERSGAGRGAPASGLSRAGEEVSSVGAVMLVGQVGSRARARAAGVGVSTLPPFVDLDARAGGR